MSFFDAFADDDPITLLLSKENLSIVDVYNEGSMLQELRTNNEELIAYFAKEDVILDLCDWSLSMKYQDHEFFDKYSRIATEIMTCKSGVARGFCNSACLRDYMNKVISSNEELDTMCAGHFQRILMHLLQNTNGEYLKKFDNFIDHLILHISSLAISELIVMLEINYYQNFSPNGECVAALSKYITQDGADVVSAVYSLRQIFNQGWEIPSIQNDLCTDSLIANMIQVSKTTNSRLGQIELVRLINSIGQKNELALIFRRGDIGEIGEIKCASSSLASQVKGVTVKDAVDGIMNKKDHWTIIPTYMHLIQFGAVDELFDAVKELQVVEKLSPMQPEELTPFQLELVRVICLRAPELSFDVSALSTINAKAQKLWTNFGGDLPIGGQTETNIRGD